MLREYLWLWFTEVNLKGKWQEWLAGCYSVRGMLHSLTRISENSMLMLWPYQHWCPLVSMGRWYLASWVLGGWSHLGAVMRGAPAWCHCPCLGWSGWRGCAFLPSASPSPSLHPLPLQRLNSGLLCSFLSALPLWLNSDWFTSSGPLLGSPRVQGPGRPGVWGSCVCMCVCVVVVPGGTVFRLRKEKALELIRI